MKIGICSDHRGIYIKKKIFEYLEHEGYEVIDYGTNSSESVDFPEYAFKLGNSLVKKKIDKGIAICGTGIGMSIALNKMKGVYCAKISSINEAILSRQHNNVNAIAFGADLDSDMAMEMVDKFIETEFSKEERRVRRNKMIKDMEKNA